MLCLCCFWQGSPQISQRQRNLFLVNRGKMGALDYSGAATSSPLDEGESRGSVAGDSNSVITLDNKSDCDLVWGNF